MGPAVCADKREQEGEDKVSGDVQLYYMCGMGLDLYFRIYKSMAYGRQYLCPQRKYQREYGVGIPSFHFFTHPFYRWEYALSSVHNNNTKLSVAFSPIIYAVETIPLIPMKSSHIYVISKISPVNPKPTLFTDQESP